MEALRPAYEEHHGVRYDTSALEAAVRYGVRYINDRYPPDKAIDLMDEARRSEPMRSDQIRSDTIRYDQIRYDPIRYDKM